VPAFKNQNAAAAVSEANECRQCGKAIEGKAQNRWWPFCSKRCQLADLGQWFAGRYSIPEDEERDAPPPQKPS
jgi:hypothetical protein